MSVNPPSLAVPWYFCTGLPLSAKSRTPMSGCVSLCTYPGTPSTHLPTHTLHTPLKQKCSQGLWSKFSEQNRKPKACRECGISSTKFPWNRFFGRLTIPEAPQLLTTCLFPGEKHKPGLMMFSTRFPGSPQQLCWQGWGGGRDWMTSW